MRAGVEEVAEMPACIRQYSRIGDADAIETQRARLVCERVFEIFFHRSKIGASPLLSGEVGSHSDPGEGFRPIDRP